MKIEIVPVRRREARFCALPRKGYRSISIPEELYLEIEEFVKKSKGKYVSTSEVVRAAIRKLFANHE